MKRIYNDSSESLSKKKKIVAVSINALVWLIGIVFLKWNVDEVYFLFMLDMFLFLSFGMLKVIFSLNYNKSFLNFLFWRLMLVLLLFPVGCLLIIQYSRVNMFNEQNIRYFLYSPNHWSYDVILLNYCGFFIHDFIYSGKYKTSNPMMEGFTDFFSIFIIANIISFLIQFFSQNQEGVDPVFYAAAIIIARSGFEIFMAFKGKAYLFDKYGNSIFKGSKE